LRLAQRYFEGELQILVDFRVGLVDEEFVACFQRTQTIGGTEVQGYRGTARRFRNRLDKLPVQMASNVDTTIG
jgi:hypothetical protein